MPGKHKSDKAWSSRPRVDHASLQPAKSVAAPTQLRTPVHKTALKALNHFVSQIDVIMDSYHLTLSLASLETMSSSIYQGNTRIVLFRRY